MCNNIACTVHGMEFHDVHKESSPLQDNASGYPFNCMSLIPALNA